MPTPPTDTAPAGAPPQLAVSLPEDAIELVLVRHGASTHNPPGGPVTLLDGHADPDLASAGREQARRVAERLAQEPLHGLFASGLRRALGTAEVIGERTGLAPVVVPDLREVHLGTWEDGAFLDRLRAGDAVAQRVIAEERWEVIPGAEASGAFRDRVAGALDAVLARSTAGSRVAVVAHGAVIGEICHQATGSRRFAFILNDNGAITRLAVLTDGRRLLRCFNDTAHLRP